MTTTYNWYKIFNLDDFDHLQIPSISKEVFLEGIGFETLLIAKGNKTTVLFRDTLLPVDFEGRNPYANGDYAVFYDSSFNVWLGIKIPEATE